MRKERRTGNSVRLAAAVLAALALSACQTVPDARDDVRTRTVEPKAKQRTAAKPAAPPRLALRGTQGTAVAPTISETPPKRADALRATALDQLSRGEVDGAVANLKAARELDPANDLIRRDLERAERIRATVSAQPQ